MKDVIVIGGGLAGAEAAWQAARAGARVRLYEMRPVKQTPAHRTDRLAEIVCSNSLKSDEPGTAPYLLKEELRRAGSLVMEAAAETRVPAGAALAVDRERFAELITERVASHPSITLVREEMPEVPEGEITIVAAGPLCSDALAESVMRLTGNTQLYFYDAISPIVAADSVNYEVAFRAARYGKGGDDYVNCPFDEQQYARFYEALLEAKSVPLQRFEETRWFEACLPIEELARRGRDTLRYGPMKPVGLPDPRTGREPYAAVQLRQENLMADAYNLVGFQNHLRFGEQARVLRLIPGLEQAEFLQFGQIHRNTYICAPRVLAPSLRMRERPEIFFAGQISGVEGYVESVATGWLAGLNAARTAQGLPPVEAPPKSATGALARYVSGANAENYQPVNITFALLEPLPEDERRRFRRKRERHARQVELALKEWDTWLQDIRGGQTAPHAAGNAV
ncbi:MAG TPA: methylenetetrahydrofolate--tRNA-(uracil(54)-C(5))-methyltransferase (FADH(2)-oxidizing) TrmFO [Pyrinomonadaceae bacterium]|nr:methylenetetrahydrofolate--tRNA-(uracil(54)-C(5))-methyltransferase (FADH(2)-oxidizing) TrmFO [Pyrinomonadaceae bacterium]